jgi:pantoate--beta-alanine ligase
MEIIQRISRMSAISSKLISSDVQIGMVSTMGVIHPGHISLIKVAHEMTDLVVVTIFANRLQFLSDGEYQRYPRDFTKDVDLLRLEKVDYVFSPEEKEMFPSQYATYAQVEGFGDKLIGVQHPAYFRGMTTTVLKMIHIVRPAFLFLGLKDALQGAILRKMIRDLNLGTEVVVTPVARHPSGLAYGTRNFFLTEPEMAAAPVVYRSLQAARELIASGERQGKKLLNEIARVIGSEPMARLEYAFVADAESLAPVNKLRGSVLIGAGARIGDTSLNDSLLEEITTE